MTGVQTCALPICFPVTIHASKTEAVAQPQNEAVARHQNEAVARPQNEAVARPQPAIASQSPTDLSVPRPIESNYDLIDHGIDRTTGTFNQTLYDELRDALGTTDSDMEEFEDIIFAPGDSTVNFRNEFALQFTPNISHNEVVGEWCVMGFDVSNQEVLDAIERIPTPSPSDSPVFFTATPISNQYCSHQRQYPGPTKCACLIYDKTSTKKYTLTTELFNDLELIKQEICCARQLGHDQLDEYRSHKAVILALSTQDKNIQYVENHAQSLRRLYAIRRLYGLDKDFGQLVTEKIKMYRPGRGGAPAEVWGVAEVCERWGIQHVDQVVDMLGLMGDAVDNIPGIPSVEIGRAHV